MDSSPVNPSTSNLTLGFHWRETQCYWLLSVFKANTEAHHVMVSLLRLCTLMLDSVPRALNTRHWSTVYRQPTSSLTNKRNHTQHQHYSTTDWAY